MVLQRNKAAYTSQHLACKEEVVHAAYGQGISGLVNAQIKEHKNSQCNYLGEEINTFDSAVVLYSNRHVL